MMKKDKPLKWCESGLHYVPALFHSKRKDRPSACALHAERKPINKQKQDTEVIKTDKGDIHIKISSSTKGKVKTGRITLSELLSQAEKVFNAWIRKRDTFPDRTFKCISCGQYFSNKEMDAGHFKSKKYAATRFHELNVNGQCVSCNRMKDGNEKLYRINLIYKIGLEKVEEIENLSRQPWKWDREILLDIIEKYKGQEKPTL